MHSEVYEVGPIRQVLRHLGLDSRLTPTGVRFILPNGDVFLTGYPFDDEECYPVTIAGKNVKC